MGKFGAGAGKNFQQKYENLSVENQTLALNKTNFFRFLTRQAGNKAGVPRV